MIKKEEYTRIRRAIDGVARRHGLSASAMTVMMELSNRGGEAIPSKTVRAAMGITAPSFSELITNLYSRGIVVIQQSNKDRRNNLLSVGRNGWQIVKEYDNIFDQ